MQHPSWVNDFLGKREAATTYHCLPAPTWALPNAGHSNNACSCPAGVRLLLALSVLQCSFERFLGSVIILWLHNQPPVQNPHPLCRSQLEQLSSDVSGSLEKLEGREQQLTGQFQGLLDSYRESRQQLTDMQEEFSRWGCRPVSAHCR